MIRLGCFGRQAPLGSAKAPMRRDAPAAPRCHHLRQTNCVPAEFIARASDKVAKINAAWDIIKRRRGL